MPSTAMMETFADVFQAQVVSVTLRSTAIVTILKRG